MCDVVDRPRLADFKRASWIDRQRNAIGDIGSSRGMGLINGVGCLKSEEDGCG